MELSIIIPVYNVENTLRRCVESVLNQSFQDFEMILVNDGSKDKSAEIADDYAAKNNKIRVIHQQNQGLSAARNAGIRLAKGNYITFIDPDDFVDLHTYQQLMERLTQHSEYDILEFSVIEKYGSKQERQLILPEKLYTDPSKYWLEGQTYLHTYACNKIYRRELFDKIEFPRGKNFEDAHTLPKLINTAKVIATTSIGTYYYCWNDAGITANANGQDLTSLLEAHLNYINKGGRIDSRYYAHILNIQLDVYEATKAKPLLPTLPYYGTLKLLLLHFLGLKGLCKLNQIIHKLVKKHH